MKNCKAPNTLPSLRRRFPIGAVVTNFGIRAVVRDYMQHDDGTCDLLLAEVKADGRLSRSRWMADPYKCVRA